MRWLRWAYYSAVQAGYVVRPYDVLADRRRWFWQPRYPCPRTSLLRYHDALRSGLSDYEAREEGWPS